MNCKMKKILKLGYALHLKSLTFNLNGVKPGFIVNPKNMKHGPPNEMVSNVASFSTKKI